MSPGRLDEIESRLATIERLKKKYGATRRRGDRVRRALPPRARGAGSPEEQERALEERRERLAATYLERARALSKKRRAAALELRKRVQAELAQLAMEKTRFEVAFAPADPEPTAADASQWTERGLERAEFLLSPEPRRGAAAARADRLGRRAVAASCWRLKSVVALRRRRASRSSSTRSTRASAAAWPRSWAASCKAVAARQQVLCVTHLPQIAALADQHLAVRKRVGEGSHRDDRRPARRPTRASRRSRACWAGRRSPPPARQHAREMLKQSLQQLRFISLDDEREKAASSSRRSAAR